VGASTIDVVKHFACAFERFGAHGLALRADQRIALLYLRPFSKRRGTVHATDQIVDDRRSAVPCHDQAHDSAGPRFPPPPPASALPREGEFQHRAPVARVEPEGPRKPGSGTCRPCACRVLLIPSSLPRHPSIRMAVAYLAYRVSIRSFEFSTSRGGCWVSPDSMTAHHPNSRDPPGARLAEHGDDDGRSSTSLRPSPTAPSITPIRVPTPFPYRELRLRQEYSSFMCPTSTTSRTCRRCRSACVLRHGHRVRPDPTAAQFDHLRVPE
jgi:hypothetical protein